MAFVVLIVKALCILGIISSIVFANRPCVFLVRAHLKWAKITFKSLAFFGIIGWFYSAYKTCAFFGDDIGWIAYFFLIGIGSVFYTAASRGEELARLKGEIEDYHGVIRYTRKDDFC
jgi:hypothetical protein